MSYHAPGNTELSRTALGQVVHKARGGSLLQFAVIVAFVVLLICYVLGVSGNTAILVFVGVISGIVALYNLLVAWETRPAPSREDTRPAPIERLIHVERAPQETSLNLSGADSVIIEIRIRNQIRATDTTSAA